jgi:hypothetical protein
MEDVKTEKAALEGNNNAGKGKKRAEGACGLTAEERNKVLVKLVSKERVIELLKESMVNAQEREEREREKGMVEEGNREIELDSFTRTLPPSYEPVPSSSSPALNIKASFLNPYPPPFSPLLLILLSSLFSLLPSLALFLTFSPSLPPLSSSFFSLLSPLLSYLLSSFSLL